MAPSDPLKPYLTPLGAKIDPRRWENSHNFSLWKSSSAVELPPQDRVGSAAPYRRVKTSHA